jgi:hypothetical protein
VEIIHLPENIQSDSKLLFGFPWPIILKPGKNKINPFMEYESVTRSMIAVIIALHGNPDNNLQSPCM